jgi:hypothetical protein
VDGKIRPQSIISPIIELQIRRATFGIILFNQIKGNFLFGNSFENIFISRAKKYIYFLKS